MLTGMRTIIFGVLLLFTASLEARLAMSPATGKGLAHKIGHAIVIGATSLTLLCTQVGCGGDDIEASNMVLVEETKAETIDSSIITEKPYIASDYLGQYVLYVSDGSGFVDSGLVVGYTNNASDLTVIPEPQKHVRVRIDKFADDDEFKLVPIGNQSHVPLRTVVGVMDLQHVDLSAIAEFDPAQAQSRHLRLFFAEPEPAAQGGKVEIDDDGGFVLIPPPPAVDLNLPTLVRGKINAVYINPVHTNDPSATFVSITIQSGFSDDEWRRLLPEDVFVSYDALTFVE